VGSLPEVKVTASTGLSETPCKARNRTRKAKQSLTVGKNGQSWQTTCVHELRLSSIFLVKSLESFSNPWILVEMEILY
jgi:hypothetical protein